jgi:hypothetical protein
MAKKEKREEIVMSVGKMTGREREMNESLKIADLEMAKRVLRIGALNRDQFFISSTGPMEWLRVAPIWNVSKKQLELKCECACGDEKRVVIAKVLTEMRCGECGRLTEVTVRVAEALSGEL